MRLVVKVMFSTVLVTLATACGAPNSKGAHDTEAIPSPGEPATAETVLQPAKVDGVAAGLCRPGERRLYSCDFEKYAVAICQTTEALNLRMIGPDSQPINVRSLGGAGSASLGTASTGLGTEITSLRFSNAGMEYIVRTAVDDPGPGSSGDTRSMLEVIRSEADATLAENYSDSLTCPKNSDHGLDVSSIQDHTIPEEKSEYNLAQ